LVYEGTPDRVVGTLFLRDAVEAKHGGRVADLMHPRVCYVHEDFSLRQILQAFARTGQFMVVVINSFEEPVGMITLTHLLTQLLGERQQDDFDAFADRAAVAAWRPATVPVIVDEPVETEESEQPFTEGID
jgi:CBS domain containing-hemolysin-like protein